jgi:hypothetical protein
MMYLHFCLIKEKYLMKRTISWCIALFALMFLAPVWSHHPAEGIISDDVWQMIDENLQDADSPHLNIDFDDVMGSMRVSEDSDRGSLFLVTSATVPIEDLDEYVVVIEEVLAGMDEVGQAPSGLSNNGKANTLSYEVIDLEDGFVEILLYEPIGAVKSQLPSNPGKGS